MDSYEAILSGIRETFAQFAVLMIKEGEEFILKPFCAGFACAGGRRQKLDIGSAKSGAQSLAEKMPR